MNAIPASRRLIAALVVLAAASAPAAPASARDRVPGELVVGFEAGGERTVELPADLGTAKAVQALERNPAIAYAAPNYIARATGFVPDDPGKTGKPKGWRASQWHFLSGPGGVRGLEAMRLLRKRGRFGGGKPGGGRGPKVAVVDSGIAYRNKGKRFRRSPDLARNAFVNPRDFVDRDRVPLDEFGHGTHMASTIAESTNNGRDVTGLAHRLKIMPVRVLDRNGAGTAGEVRRGIRWAARKGAKVINMSFEFGASVASCSKIPGVCRALRYARRKGALVVAAAGNAGRNGVSYPAAARSAMAVAGTTVRGCAGDYSNRGSKLDISGPGGGRDYALGGARCDPLAADNPGIVQLTLRDSAVARGKYRSFGYPRYVGTSSATAHVSAVAGLVLASRVLHRELGHAPNPERLRKWLKQRAQPLGDSSIYGAGLVDAYASLRR